MYYNRIMSKVWYIAGALLVATAGLLLLFSRRPEEEVPYEIGVLNFTKAAEPALEGFKEGMSDAGYIEGETVRYHYSGVFPEAGPLREEADRLIALPVDLMFTMSTAATSSAQAAAAGTDIPIVFGPVSNPIEGGIVTDLRHPEKNTTGVMFGLQEEKRLGLLKEFDSSVETVVAPYNPADRSPVNSLRKLEGVVQNLDLEFIHAHVESPDHLERVLEEMPRETDAVFIPTDPIMAMLSGRIAAFGIERGLITTSPHRGGVKEGILYSYSFDHQQLGREAARLAVQILEGAQPEDLPVEMGEFYLTINVTTAELIGVEIPASLLRRATVYE
jgi:putative ABC transport system substrate-binding protein